jgi:hypothetical protein
VTLSPVEPVPPRDSVELYIDYRDFITVQQVHSLLRAVDDAYEQLFFAQSPQLADVAIRPRSRLRARRLETGNSLTVEFLAGVEQIVDDVDPMLRGVGGGAVVLGLTTRVLISCFRRYSIVAHEHRTRALQRRGLAERVDFLSVARAVLENELIRVPGSRDPMRAARVADRLSASVGRAAEVLDQSNLVEVTLAGERVKGDPPDESTANDTPDG